MLAIVHLWHHTGAYVVQQTLVFAHRAWNVTVLTVCPDHAPWHTRHLHAQAVQVTSTHSFGIKTICILARLLRGVGKARALFQRVRGSDRNRQQDQQPGFHLFKEYVRKDRYRVMRVLINRMSQLSVRSIVSFVSFWIGFRLSHKYTIFIFPSWLYIVIFIFAHCHCACVISNL